MTTPAIELTKGSVFLGSTKALDQIDFRVNTGEFVALLGANGSGKTTLVRALLGLVPLASGELRLFGVPAQSFGERGRLGYVPQRFGAVAGVPASVEEVVLSGRVRRPGWLRSYGQKDRRAGLDALEVVDMADLVRRPVAELSGGQQQRVLIARALVGEPDVLVLDEPIAGVDVHHQQSFADTLERLHETGRSIVLVAHELGALAPLVGRTVVLAGGRVTYDGPPLEEHLHHEHIHHHPRLEREARL